MINEINGEKIAYSSSENQMKTSLKEKKLVYKNGKYPILNQDTEGFEFADDSQIKQVNKNIDKNIGIHLNDRVHIVIYLAKDKKGLDNCDVPFLIKLHKMKILYYFIYPKKEGLTELFQNKPKRLMNALINKINNNEEEFRKLFKNDNKNETLKILEQIKNKLEETVFSADILTPNSKGVIALLEQIKKDLSKIYDIHQKYINIVEEQKRKNENRNI